MIDFTDAAHIERSFIGTGNFFEQPLKSGIAAKLKLLTQLDVHDGHHPMLPEIGEKFRIK